MIHYRTICKDYISYHKAAVIQTFGKTIVKIGAGEISRDYITWRGEKNAIYKNKRFGNVL